MNTALTLEVTEQRLIQSIDTSSIDHIMASLLEDVDNGSNDILMIVDTSSLSTCQYTNRSVSRARASYRDRRVTPKLYH